MSDRFLVIKLFNEKVSDLRYSLHREATETIRKNAPKGWLLLKNPANLNKKRDEKKRLMEALSLNQSPAVAYYLKEVRRRFWMHPARRLQSLSSKAESGVPRRRGARC